MANFVETGNHIVPNSAGARDLNAVLSHKINAWLFPSLLVGGVLAIGHWYVSDPERLNCLNIAGEAVKGDAGELVNGLRVPLYPALIALITGIACGSKEIVISELHSLAVAAYPFDVFCAHALDAPIAVQLSDASTFKNPVENCRSDQLFLFRSAYKAGACKILSGAHTCRPSRPRHTVMVTNARMTQTWNDELFSLYGGALRDVTYAWQLDCLAVSCAFLTNEFSRLRRLVILVR